MSDQTKITNRDDIIFLAKILSESSWLFYGEFEVYLNSFLKSIFQKELKDFGFDEKLPNDFQVAYWSVLSELKKLNLVDYGTSPRGAWLTEEGERFKRVILENDNAIQEAVEITSDEPELVFKTTKLSDV